MAVCLCHFSRKWQNLMQGQQQLIFLPAQGAAARFLAAGKQSALPPPAMQAWPE